ncbi:DUF4097 family beta strand repeat-containing protein [Wukongibacter baidiensis]|uniref:DUF4097 family beta strand repeat-containing protein n=1 Tax=Wukongibacter baidiensis TaxID=1723361 RepID=UPI003D7FD3A2
MIKNMKKIVLWLFIIMIASFSISIILFRNAGVDWNDIADMDDDYSNFEEISNVKGKFKKNINEEKSFDIQGIDDVNISTISADIRIIPEDRNDIRVHFYGAVASSNEIGSPKLIAEKQNNSLQIKIDHKKLISSGFYSSRIDLDIYVPNEYSKNIDVKTTSGDIDLGILNIKDISAKSVSGDINADSLYSEKSSFKSTSGEITLRDFKGMIDAKTTSGDIDIDFNALENDVNIGSISGSIELGLPNNSGFYLESKSLSGDIECDFPISIEGKHSERKVNGRVGQDNNRIVLSTTSGDIEISKK